MDTEFIVAPRSWFPPAVERRACADPAPRGLAPMAAPEAEFAELCRGLQASGGLVAADQLAAMMRHGSAQPLSRLARWIVSRQVVTVPWRSQTLLPLFQFGECGACLRPGLPAVMTELTHVFDDRELALWFARCNSSLGGAVPADCLATRPVDVWQAARTDRFIATGA